MPSSSCSPQVITSLSVRNILRAPEAYIDRLYVGKNRQQTLDAYLEQRLFNLTNLEAAIDAKLQSMQQVMAQQVAALQQQSSSSNGQAIPPGLQQTLQSLEQRIQQLEYRPAALQGPQGSQGIPGPQGPPGKPGPRGLRGQAGGAKKLSELSDIELPPKIKEGSILTYNSEKEVWVPMLFDDSDG